MKSTEVIKTTVYFRWKAEKWQTVWKSVSGNFPRTTKCFWLPKAVGVCPELSDRQPLPDEPAVLEEAVSSWRLFLSPRINSQRLSSCCDRGSITDLICLATSSNVTDTLGDVSISWSDILLGVFSIRLSVSVLLSVSSVSTARVLFINWKTGWD